MKIQVLAKGKSSHPGCIMHKMIVLASQGKRAISVQAIEVLMYKRHTHFFFSTCFAQVLLFAAFVISTLWIKLPYIYSTKKVKENVFEGL